MENIKLSIDNKYNLLKQSIEKEEYLSPDDLDNQIDSETLKRLIDELDLSGKTLDMLVFYTSRYSSDALTYLVNKVNDDKKIYVIKRLKLLCSNSIDTCLQVKRFLTKNISKVNISREKSREYYNNTRDVLEEIFKKSVTREPINKELELSPSQLIIVFLKYKDDMKKLKFLIEDAIIPPVKEFLPTFDYIRDIAVAYGTIYTDYKHVDLMDFVHYFQQEFLEKKAIQCCRNTDANVLDYEYAYEDDNVRIHYVRELNGLYVENKEAEIYNEKFYLYPEEDANGDTVLVRRNYTSPFDLYNEYKSKKTYCGQVKRCNWPKFNSDNFIDLSCDPNLETQEEKYKRTKQIIESCWILSLLIEIDEKVYKKESNN